MAKNIFIVLLMILGTGCKKSQFSSDDINLFKWKRDLYRTQVQKEQPASFYSKDGKVASNQNAILVSSDIIVLSEYRKDRQQDSIYIATGKMQIYKYEKLEKVNR